MSNPNNNKNFNDEALRINRALKKENDALKVKIAQLRALSHDRHNSDEEEFKKESKELRDYDFLRSEHE
tara:strand:- start:1302 stop:1508 length:207 start_codon:yes stop_codon:yes gene_type:complete